MGEVECDICVVIGRFCVESLALNEDVDTL